MGRLSGFHYREVIRRLRMLGFLFDRQAAGSHEIWRHAVTGRKTVVPHHAKPVAEGTLRAILRQGGVDVDDFLNV